MDDGVRVLALEGLKWGLNALLAGLVWWWTRTFKDVHQAISDIDERVTALRHCVTNEYTKSSIISRELAGITERLEEARTKYHALVAQVQSLPDRMRAERDRDFMRSAEIRLLIAERKEAMERLEAEILRLRGPRNGG